MTGAASTIIITYDGTDITGSVVFANTHFTSSAAASPGTATVRCKDPNRSLAFLTGRELTLDVDGQRLWGGYVLQVDYIHAFPADDTTDPETYRNRMFDLQCVDYNIMLDKRVVRNAADYYHFISYTAPIYDGAVIRDVLTNYIDQPSGFTFDSNSIEDVYYCAWSSETPQQQIQQGWKVRDAFKKFVSQSAAIYYVSPDKVWTYRSIEHSVKRWGFSDVPLQGPVVLTGDPDPIGTGATYPFREVTATEDSSLLINDALVWGGSPFGSGGQVVFARAQDATSESQHGRWQAGETYFNNDGLHGTQAGVDARADAIVFGNDGMGGTDALGQMKGYGNAQWHFHFAWFGHDVPFVSGERNHVRPGDLVVIDMQSFFGAGHARLLPCRSLEMTFLTNDAGGDTYVRFDADFALNLEDPVRLWEFLRLYQTTIGSSVTTTVEPGSGTTVYGAYGQSVPTPATDGVTTVFYIPFGYITNQLNVFQNGLNQRSGTDFIESDAAAGEFTMTSAPLSSDNLYCTYRTLAS